MELAALILSGIAIIVSVIFGIRQLKLGSDQHDLAARLGAIEEARRTEELDARARADLTARYEERPGHADERACLL